MSDSVRKAFQLLGYLARQPEKTSLAIISKKTAMNKTTAFRYLDTLTKLQMVEKSESGYSLGIGLFELGNRVPVQQAVVERIHPRLADLCGELNETVNLARLQDHEALYLDKIESRHSLQMQSRIGSRLPLYCTGLGKAILSLLPPDQLDRVLARIQFVPGTPATITDPEILKQQIIDIKSRGYALDLEELETGLICVAVPLPLERVQFLGAISVSGPAFRFTAEMRKQMARKLRAAAARIQKGFQQELFHD